MSKAPPASDKDAWLAWIKERAQIEMPVLLRSVHTQRLQPITPPRTGVWRTVTLPDTGAIPKVRDTALVPIVQLLPQEETRHLVSQAVAWFYRQYGILPERVALNALRCLQVNQTYFPVVDCEDLGCFTIEIEAAAELSREVCLCRARRVTQDASGAWVWGWMEDYYL